MSALLRRAEGFEDLLEIRDHDLPYRFETIFDDESRGARNRSKKKFKLLRAIDEELRRMLDQGEEVRFLTEGTIFTFWESYLLGWLLHFFNKRAVVLTDRRIILLQVRVWSSKPGVLASQIRYRGIAKVRGRLLGGAKLELRDGKSVRFTGMPRSDRKFLQDLVERLREAGITPESGEVGREELCPHCHAVVSLGDRECPACRGTFKSPRVAGLRSLLFPGLGDFYMGHKALATIEFLFALIVWVVLFMPGAGDPWTRIELVFVALILIVFIHVPDAVATWYLARRGVFPEEAGRLGPAARRASAGSLSGAGAGG
ncbi:MAG TPA: zinc ribbon domain-containing protein [Longimicrobiales bacterium]|nr:zinc ribbon domain-containing protein [Longimicrobiales bacterium]